MQLITCIKLMHEIKINLKKKKKIFRGATTQSVESPLKVPGWFNSADVCLKHPDRAAYGGRKKKLAAPLVEVQK